MSEINRLPDDEMSLNDLPESIRRAVEHLRSQPPPKENMQRALDRAVAMKFAPPRKWFNLRPELQIRIAVAAAVVMAVAVGLSTNILEHGKNEGAFSLIESSVDEFALADEPAVTSPSAATWKHVTELGKIQSSDHFQSGEKLFDGDQTLKPLNSPAIRDGNSNTMNGGQHPIPDAKPSRALVTKRVTPQSNEPSASNSFRPPYGGFPGISTNEDQKEAKGHGALGPAFAGGVNGQVKYGIDPEVLKALGEGKPDLASVGPGGWGGGYASPIPRPQQGPLNNGSLQPGFVFGFQPVPNPSFQGGRPSSGNSANFSGGFGGGSFSGGSFGGGGFGGSGSFGGSSGSQVMGGGSYASGAQFPVPLNHNHSENGGFYAAGSFALFRQTNSHKSEQVAGGFGGPGWSWNSRQADADKSLRGKEEIVPHLYAEIDHDGLADVAAKVQETKTGRSLSYPRILGGYIDEKTKEKNLTEKWGAMPQADRQKALNAIVNELPARYKEPVTTYFRNLESSKSENQPQVWRRDQQRPTFARVYLGGGNSLDLVSLQVSVNVEGPRARTVVDHIFHNPHDRQLEGTFEYPLPTGASVSYFGMYQGQNRPNAPPRFGNGGQAPPALRALTQPGSPTSTATQPASPTDLARLDPSELAHHVSGADWGPLQEARVVGKQKALETYEEIVRGRIDPALLEYSGGNTFTGRVFPIAAKGYSRVIIAYEELLPVVNEHALYRFPLPNCKLSEVQFTLQANQADFSETVFLPKVAKKEIGGGRVVYSHSWNDADTMGEVLFAGLPSRAQVQAITGRQGESGPSYLYARVRPQLKTESSRPFSDHAVFLLDTSLSEHPDRFAVSMKLWQQILQGDSGIKKFNILAFNVGTTWIEPKGWLENTAEGRNKALARLDGIVLEGATDLSAALSRLTPDRDESRLANNGPLSGLANQQPLEVFLLSDGQITWGNRDTNSLVASFESKCPYSARFHCYTIGLGAENTELFQALTRRGGGIYPCYTEAYLPYAARAHRNHCLLVERVSFKGGPAINDVLLAGRQAAVYPGGELVVAARLNAESKTKSEPGAPHSGGPGGTGTPAGRTALVVEGTFLGERVVYEYPIEIGSASELAARGWGELAVSSLLALSDAKLDSLVTAYCQQFGIGSRVASFLVLENQADYKRLNLEEERGKAVPGGDLEKFLDDAWRNLARVIKPRQAYEHFLKTIEGRLNLRLLNWGPKPVDFVPPFGSPRPPFWMQPGFKEADHIRNLLFLLSDNDFELPETATGGALVIKKDVSPAYLNSRQANPLNVQTYLEESKRRANANDAQGAMRALSSVVELFPTRADALRLVGYRLLDLQQPANAARLFQQVEESRPFEPHSYRDLARSLEESGRYGFAALQYEIVLAGTWHNRFRDSLKVVAREEYAHMMQEALKDYRNTKLENRISKELAEYFGERLEGMSSVRQQADLRVTISWNTDNTDVDLWVLEPDGTKCFYQNQKTSSGGQLSQDQTQGYGPERYQIEKAQPGIYTVIVHYFRADTNLLAGESHVNVMITKHAGTPEETVERHTVLLKQANEQVEVCKLKVR
jgi:tetratricopeptide (TPR) repeat protein